MQRRQFTFSASSVLLAGCARESDAATFEALKLGGHVLYFRHAATDRSGVDMPDWSRARQRNLSAFGKQQSRKIGAGISGRGIPVGQVLASPFYRCTDMAELAFGRSRKDRGLLSSANKVGDVGGRVNYLKRRLTTPFKGPNLVLISHSNNIRLAAGTELSEGEAAVFRPRGRGVFEELAIVAPEMW